MTKIPDFLVSSKPGVYQYKDGSFTCVLDEQGDQDYYGITWSSDTLYCSSPYNLYRFDKSSNMQKTPLKDKSVGDIHQILYHGGVLYLTNTEYNSIDMLDPVTLERVDVLEVGDQRRDINHINSLFFKNNKLYACFHNNNTSNADIVEYTDKKQTRKLSDLGRMNHNIYIDDSNTLFNLDSKNGCVVKINLDKPALRDKINFRQKAETYNFGRGFAKTKDLFLIGVSHWAKKRKERESTRGFVIVFDNDFNLIEKISLPVDAQVKDIRVTSEPDLAHNEIPYPL